MIQFEFKEGVKFRFMGHDLGKTVIADRIYDLPVGTVSSFITALKARVSTQEAAFITMFEPLLEEVWQAWVTEEEGKLPIKWIAFETHGIYGEVDITKLPDGAGPKSKAAAVVVPPKTKAHKDGKTGAGPGTGG